MDLVLDPVDVSGRILRKAYSFISGYDTAVPTRAIDRCATHFVPLALADLDPVCTQADFCRAFEARSRMSFERFAFHNYDQHNLVRAIVLLRAGRDVEGQRAVEEFCRKHVLDPSDKVLAEYVRLAADHAAQLS